MVYDFRALDFRGFRAWRVFGTVKFGFRPQGSSAQQSPKTAFAGSEFRPTCT